MVFQRLFRAASHRKTASGDGKRKEKNHDPPKLSDLAQESNTLNKDRLLNKTAELKLNGITEDAGELDLRHRRNSINRAKKAAENHPFRIDARGSLVVMDSCLSSASELTPLNCSTVLRKYATRDESAESVLDPMASHTPATRYKCATASSLDPIANFTAPVNLNVLAHRAFITKALEGNLIFSKFPVMELSVLVSAFEKITVDPGESIIVQGEVGDYFYIIFSGTVMFLVDGNEVGEAYDGTGFGEMALIYDCPRAATCQSVTPCSLFRVDQKTFRRILFSNSLRQEEEAFDVLKKVPFLAKLDKKYLNRIVARLNTVDYKQGDSIFCKGDEGIAFYVVRRGNVAVTDIEVGGTTFADTVLGPGDYFGERAIVKMEPRVANASAVSDVTLLCLTRDDFNKTVGDLSDLMVKSADLRILEGTVEPWQCDMLVGRIKEMEFERGHFFFKEGLMATFLNSAIYFIRDGKIEVSNEKGQMVELKSGAFFGESTLKTFWKAMQESETGKVDNILALRTAQCLERCKLGVLSIAVIEDIIGIEHIHFKEFRNTKFEKMKDKLDWTITLDSLEKHYLLGKGVFGEVWLVSKRQDEAAKNAKERPIVYALKSQDKRYLLEHHDVNFVIREKNIMSSIDCPFIMKLVNTYQDERSIYMLMALGHGGELFNIICNQRISEGHTKFYAAGILVGLRYMHDRNILYRDIKAENILIDDKGYPVIIDMGFAKISTDKAYTFCGTPQYVAPEVIQCRGYDMGADNWSWAVLIYEMIFGTTPFFKDGIDQITLFENIQYRPLTFPGSMMTEEAKDLVRKMLEKRPTDRLGSFARGEEDIKDHPWFKGFDFDALERKQMATPFVPKISDPLDSSNFERLVQTDYKKGKILTEVENEIFKDF